MITSEILSNIDPGSYIKIKMNELGEINSSLSSTLTERIFEVIAIGKYCFNYFALVNYGEEELFNASSLTDNILYNGDGNFHISHVIKKKDNINSYMGKYVRWLNAERISGIENCKQTSSIFERGGCACRDCKEFYDYAVPNQADGKTLICYACRLNPVRAYY